MRKITELLLSLYLVGRFVAAAVGRLLFIREYKNIKSGAWFTPPHYCQLAVKPADSEPTALYPNGFHMTVAFPFSGA